MNQTSQPPSPPPSSKPTTDPLDNDNYTARIDRILQALEFEWDIHSKKLQEVEEKLTELEDTKETMEERTRAIATAMSELIDGLPIEHHARISAKYNIEP